MKKLLNTLYITNPDAYLKREGENILIFIDGRCVKRYPIHILSQIICFNYMGVSPSLMKLCMKSNVSISFYDPHGNFCGRVIGKSYGNIYTRKKQYKISESDKSLDFSKNIIYAKAYNSRKLLIRGKLDHKNKINLEKMEKAIYRIKNLMLEIPKSKSKDELRGIEGKIASEYFSVFDELIVKQRENFYFNGRNKRPPLDRVNALLSFMYSILANNIAQALEGVGIDSYAGFFHTDRPGRVSMALDIIEEMRAPIVDKFVLSLINLNRLDKNKFEVKENNATLLNDKGRNIVLNYWNDKCHEEIYHPFIEEKIPIGLLPHIQAQLLNSYLREDIESYPPYLRK